MNNILEQLAICVERGKVDQKAVYPPDLKGQDGTDELTKLALSNHISPTKILEDALMIGMRKIGDKFSKGEAFIPDLLISAKAMKTAMLHLKPFFKLGDIKLKGTFIIGTVQGDMHDIGKNLVKMVLEGAGWQVVDLGTNIDAEKFKSALAEHPGALVGLSALLTTTMLNMETITRQIKETYPKTQVFVGGAPLTKKFNDKIGADGYFRDPREFANFLEAKLKSEEKNALN